MNEEIINDTIKMSIFSKIKTNNAIIDTILSAIILSLIGYIMRQVTFKNIKVSCFYDFKSLFFRKNTIIIEGKKNTSTSYGNLLISAVFSQRFKSILQETINSINTNDTIYTIKELASFENIIESESELLIPIQNQSFILNKKLNIYAKISTSVDESINDSKDKSNSKIDCYTIKLYSYETSLYEMNNYINSLVNKSLKKIENSRTGKIFIYSLKKADYVDCSSECWKENIFTSCRTFDTLFFKEKKKFITKFDFFINNKEWYDKNQYPYKLGILLFGAPGTGKTSLIKATANYTKRHIVTISFKGVKTKEQFLRLFFENRYSYQNVKNSIGFDKKIIVMEDIDCISDIVLNRDKKYNNEINNSQEINLENLEKLILKKDTSDTLLVSSKQSNDTPLTLDVMLEVFDGLVETTGSIIIFTTNHVKDLDPALIRPGRVDIMIEMTLATHEMIKEMYFGYFNIAIDEEELKIINDNFYSPAEIQNIYQSSFEIDNEINTKTNFISRLKMNIKLEQAH